MRRKRVTAKRRTEQRPIRLAAGGLATIAAAAGEDADGKPKLGTFKGNAYTGAVMEPGGWYGRIICDLAGIKVPGSQRPVLRQHDHEQLVGHTAVEVTDEGVLVDGVFSGEKQHTDKVTVPAKNGFAWQLSIGATPTRTEFLEAGEEAEVNGRTVTGPLTIARETELGEVSFVPLGADGDTSADVQASSRSAHVKKLKAALRKLAGTTLTAAQIDAMTRAELVAAIARLSAEDDKPEAEDDEDAEAEDDDEDAEAEDDEDAECEDDEEEKPKAKAKAGTRTKIRAGRRSDLSRMADIRAERKAAADEVRRVSGIKARLAKYPGATVKAKDGTEQDLVAYAIEHGWSADKAEMRAELHALRASRPGAGVGVPGGLAFSTTTPEVGEAVIEAAVFQALRHQFMLNEDSFYFDTMPDKATVRRVPQYVEREARADFSARYNDQAMQAAHTRFKGRITLQEALDYGASLSGMNPRTLSWKSEQGVRASLGAWHFREQSRFQAEGASALSISNILSNVQNKFALQGYLFGEQAWRKVCAIRPVNDFKPVKTINLLGNAMFQKVGPTGELANMSVGDQAFSNQADPYGIIGTLPWTDIVNDDLGMLGTIPQKLGQGAILALNDLIWTLWAAMVAGTVNGDDGNAFFRTTSSMTAAAKAAGTAYKPNKTSGGASALSAAALQVVKALFDNQVDPNGNPLGYDGVKPVLLYGPSNYQTATALLQAGALVYGGATAALQPDKNVWAGMFDPVMSRYVESASYLNTTTGWGVLFNPVALAAVEVCFVGGTDTPTILQAGPDFQFDRLGISLRGTMPFGAKQQNFRAAVWSLGA